MNKRIWCLGLIAAVLALAGRHLSAEPEPAKKPVKPQDAPAKDTAKPATHKVEKGPFKVEVTVKGIFESENMTEVSLNPEAWTPKTGGMLTVLKAVDHGTNAHKGDTLVEIDPEQLDDAIRDLETDRHLADLSIKLAEEEMPTLEKFTPLDLAAADRSKKQADEDLKLFLDVVRPHSEKMAHYQVKSAGQYLEYAKEELRQLEKMYRSKDLTEETEEIILKRQRHAVESAQFYYKTAELERDFTLKTDLPRRQQNLSENAVKQGLSLERAKATLPLTLNQKRLALDKLKYDRGKAEERLAKLKEDRKMMTIKAPADGIVYYGKCSRGTWGTAAMMASKLQRGGIVMPSEVILTIVQPRPLFIRAVVEEKDVHWVRPDLKGKAVPVPYPDLKLAAKVGSVSAIPITPGNFEARIDVDAGVDSAAIMPGMACTVKLLPYVKADALTVPATAVFTDDLDEDKHFVYLPGKEGKPEKRFVTVGHTSEGKTEIKGGLQEGDEVLQEKPASAGKKG
jgi:multidrug efflux pump subunit AcrA (membrane-fusion protein)